MRTRADAQNVVAALQLHESSDRFLARVHVRRPAGTALVVVSVDGDTKATAERAAQQVAIVFATIARARLGAVDGGPVVTVWDSPTGTARRVGPHGVRDGLLGGACGLLLGAALVAWQRGTGTAPPEDGNGRRPEERAPVREPGPPTQPEPEPEPEPVEPAAPLGGRWKLAELERLASAAVGDRRAELVATVDQLRAFAGPDGSLPPSLDALVEDVFGF